MNIAVFYRPASPGERASQIDQLISERNELLKELKYGLSVLPTLIDDGDAAPDREGRALLGRIQLVIAKAEARS
jgi:hypothetical protein